MQSMRAIYDIIDSSAETKRALNTGFAHVNLHGHTMAAAVTASPVLRMSMASAVSLAAVARHPPGSSEVSPVTTTAAAAVAVAPAPVVGLAPPPTMAAIALATVATEPKIRG